MESPKKLNIFFLASWYPSRINRSLGIFIRRHAEAISLNHKLTVVHAVADEAMKEGEFRLDRKEVNPNLHEVVLYYGKAETGLRIFRSWKNWKLLQKHLDFALMKAVEHEGKPDLLHLQVIWPFGSAALRFVRKHRIPLITTEHWTGYQPEDGRYRGRMMKAMTRKVIRKSQTVITVSEQLHKAMLQCGLKGNYAVVSNVVNTEQFRFKHQPSEHGVIRFIHVSSLDEAQKNVTGLIRAFAAAKKQHSAMQLTIVGSGNDEAFIKRFSNEMGLTTRGVDFKPFADAEALNELFAQSDALVLNSRYENQPVVMLEAFVCGLPVIAPSVGGIPEWVNADRGILFPPGNAEALTAAMLEFTRNPGNWSGSGIAAFAAENVSPAAIAEAHDRIYAYFAG